MLLAMVLNEARPMVFSAKTNGESSAHTLTDRLPLLTALLGLIWNLGALVSCGLYELRGNVVSSAPAFLEAAAFTALGFLPAVVVNAVLRTEATLKAKPKAVLLVSLAYCLSGVAG